MPPRPARVLAVPLLLVAALAQEPKAGDATGFLPRTVTVNGAEHRYAVHVPRQFRAGVWWPLVMFLHAANESGSDGVRQTEVGLGPAIRAAPGRWPFFVVFPQKPTRDAAWRDHEALVMATLAATEQQYPIDTRARHLTGSAQGGAGVWAIGAAHASTWATLAPVGGHGDPAALVAPLRRQRIWAFHRLGDHAPSGELATDICAAIEAAGGRPVLTRCENRARDAADEAYRESVLAEWSRTVIDNPAVAEALARPEALQGTLTVQTLTGEVEFVDAERGEVMATDSITLSITSTRATVTVSKEGAAVGRAVLTRADGQRTMARHLATLCRAGLLEIGPPVEYGPEAERTLIVGIETPAGLWSWTADLRMEDPHGRYATHWAAVSGVAAALRRVVARR